MENKLDELLKLLKILLDLLQAKATQKPYYTTEEFAAMEDKAPYTVQEWCRGGRIYAIKSGSRSGPYSRWIISHEEWLRYRAEGLLPIQRGRKTLGA